MLAHLTTRISSILPLLLAISTTLATAQESTENPQPTSSAPPDPSPYPTATIFLPGSLHGIPGNGMHLAASVITADVNQTAYAVGCMYAPTNGSTPGTHSCGLQSSITVTGGESTLIYTYNPIVTTDNGMPGTSDAPPTTHDSGATINCNLSGGTRATAATCTGSSQIPGLGRVGSSTTLASTQIDYATLTVTAGRAMLAQASEAAERAGEGKGGDGSGSDGEGGGERSGAAGVAGPGMAVFWGGVVVGLGGLGVGVL